MLTCLDVATTISRIPRPIPQVDLTTNGSRSSSHNIQHITLPASSASSPSNKTSSPSASTVRASSTGLITSSIPRSTSFNLSSSLTPDPRNQPQFSFWISRPRREGNGSSWTFLSHNISASHLYEFISVNRSKHGYYPDVDLRVLQALDKHLSATESSLVAWCLEFDRSVLRRFISTGFKIRRLDLATKPTEANESAMFKALSARTLSQRRSGMCRASFSPHISTMRARAIKFVSSGCELPLLPPIHSNDATILALVACASTTLENAVRLHDVTSILRCFIERWEVAKENGREEGPSIREFEDLETRFRNHAQLRREQRRYMDQLAQDQDFDLQSLRELVRGYNMST